MCAAVLRGGSAGDVNLARVEAGGAERTGEEEAGGKGEEEGEEVQGWKEVLEGEGDGGPEEVVRPRSYEIQKAVS